VNPPSKLRWEGTPSVAHEARAALGCSALVVALVALSALLAFFVGERPASYAWPAPLGTALACAASVALAVFRGSFVRDRVTTRDVSVSSLEGTKRYVIPRDATFTPGAGSGGSIHLGEVPFEERDRSGALVARGTETLRLTGLGAERGAVLRALEEARSDEHLDPFLPRALPGRWWRRFVAARSPLPLPGFTSAMPFEVPPRVARAVRGALSRSTGIPVDWILPGEKLETLWIYEAFSLAFDMEDALGAKLDGAALEALVLTPGACVADLALGVARALGS